MILLLTAALLATGPVSLMSESQLDEHIITAHGKPFLERIDTLSKMFVGTTYGEFPLGDGIAETTASVYCPYCNETVEIAIDPGGGASQEYVEDCEVCCQPWTVNLRYNGDGTAKVSLTPLDQ